MSPTTPDQTLATPMEDNDSGASTIHGYLVALLSDLWAEGEGFSGKRPFGNSGWEWDLFTALAKAGHITAVFDEDGYVDTIDDREQMLGREMVAMAIRALGAPAPAGAGSPDGVA